MKRFKFDRAYTPRGYLDSKRLSKKRSECLYPPEGARLASADSG